MTTLTLTYGVAAPIFWGMAAPARTYQSIEEHRSFREAIAKLGGVRPAARALGVSPQAISQWRWVPQPWVIEVEKLTGIPRDQLRPDLVWPKD